jgi:CheY-like chemotaxis protein
MDIESHPFDLRECVESALDLVSVRATEKHLDTAYVFEGDVPVAISTDLTRLRQILLNLLANAVKFTERGEVVLTVTSAPAANGRVGLTFAVRDTGIGLSADGLSRLFKSFSQADSSTTRKYGRHRPRPGDQPAPGRADGGRMWAESEGRGTVRCSRSPSRRRSADLATTRRRDFVGSQPELEGKRVLIVDDNADQPAHPRAAGGQVGDGRARHRVAGQALALVVGRRATRGPFDLAILDMHMPEMDGLELARRVRALAPKLPLVLFSSLGRREAGDVESLFNAYLAKPLRQSQLFDTRSTCSPTEGVAQGGARVREPQLDPRWRRATRCASCSPRTMS